MEIVYALVIGVLAASGTWLLLRPRTFQVLMGLSLLSYAVNLFIFCRRPAGDRHAAHHRGRRHRRPCALRRPGAAISGVDRDRDRLRDHGPVLWWYCSPCADCQEPITSTVRSSDT